MNTKPTEPLSRFVETRMDLDRSSVGCFFITQWAVLVAIAIPVFNSQLEKARESTDIANIRDYYAEITTALVTNDLDFSNSASTMKVTGGADAKVSAALTGADGTFTIQVSGGTFKVNQKVAQWQSGAIDVAGATINATDDMVGKTKINYIFTVTAASANSPSNTYLSSITFE